MPIKPGATCNHDADVQMLRLSVSFYKRSKHTVYSRRENEAQELRKVDPSCVQSTTSNSLTAVTTRNAAEQKEEL